MVFHWNKQWKFLNNFYVDSLVQFFFIISMAAGYGQAGTEGSQNDWIQKVYKYIFPRMKET